MSESQELQDEEREVLTSIYEGDSAFKQINPTTFHYKFGEEDDTNSYLIEIKWTADYPNECPEINLDTFYNRNIVANVKTRISDTVKEEASQWLGSGMTYTLLECLREKNAELLVVQPGDIDESKAAGSTDVVGIVDKSPLITTTGGNSKTIVKKEQLTKAQKRRAWEHSDHKGEKPRGYNWVDIVKHLSQSGGKEEGGSIPTNYDG